MKSRDPLLVGLRRRQATSTRWTFPEQGFTGLTVRLRDVATGDWSIYWANSRDGDPRGAAGHRPVRERRRPVLRRRGARRPGDPGALHLVAHHRRLRPLGAGVLARRRGNLEANWTAEFTRLPAPAAARCGARPRLTGEGAAGRLAGSQNHLKATLAERKCQTERGADHGTDRVHRRNCVRRNGCRTRYPAKSSATTAVCVATRPG